MKGGEKMSGGKVDLDAVLDGVKNIGKNFQVLPGSGHPMKHAVATRLAADQMQTEINNLSGGGIASTSMKVDCPTVVGSTPQQQASSCALFKTTAETNIQTRLFNQIGGRRKRKRRRTIQANKTRGNKTRGNKTQGNKTRGNKTRGNKSRGNKSRGNKSRDNKSRRNKSIRSKNRKFTKRR